MQRSPTLVALLAASACVLALSACYGDPDASDAADSADADADADSDADGDGDCVDAPTWHRDVAPIVVGSCSGCHTTGGIGPMALTNYEQTVEWAPDIVGAVDADLMPPFHARSTSTCTPPHGFLDDPRLSEMQKQTLRDWAECGAPEGDADDPSPIPEPPETELTDFDVEMIMPSAYEVAGKNDSFQCLVLDAVETTRYLEAIQVIPGNEKVVHHVLVWADKSGQSANMGGEDGIYPCFATPGTSDFELIGGWAPGMGPMVTPPNTGMVIEAGTRIVLNVHYHPTGGAAEIDDETGVRIRWMTSFPQYFALMLLIGNFDGPAGPGNGLLPDPETGDLEFRIPAGEANHLEHMAYTLPSSLPDNIRLWQVGTHMHYVGKSMAIGIERRDEEGNLGPAECLVNTPEWDFNWQRLYAYDVPLDEVPVAQPGDRLRLECRYNNSLDNAAVAAALDEQGMDAPVDVFLGEQTLDEMCLGLFGVAVAVSDL